MASTGRHRSEGLSFHLLKLNAFIGIGTMVGYFYQFRNFGRKVSGGEVLLQSFRELVAGNKKKIIALLESK